MSALNAYKEDLVTSIFAQTAAMHKKLVFLLSIVAIEMSRNEVEDFIIDWIKETLLTDKRTIYFHLHILKMRLFSRFLHYFHRNYAKISISKRNKSILALWVNNNVTRYMYICVHMCIYIYVHMHVCRSCILYCTKARYTLVVAGELIPTIL